jgi:cobalt-zinc-cadmium efflux system membrane fusion protein
MSRAGTCLLLLVALGMGAACARERTDTPAHEHAGEESSARGPHGGRWLEDGAFALELVLVEDGGEPELRGFVYRDKRLADPSGVELEVTLRRLGDRIERIGFAPHADHLRGAPGVAEPHSFDVEVRAREGGREHRWEYASYEGRVTLAPDQIAAVGIAIARAQTAAIRERVVLFGRVVANEDALVHVMPRFPGVVRSVHKRLGDAVAPRDLLAVIESNESLHPFELRAPLAGTVIARDVSPGEFVSSERELFQIADLTTVWVDLDVHRRDFTRLRAGQPVRIDPSDGSPAVETTLAYLSPVGSPNTQTLLARAVLPNPDRSWRPGLFATGEVEVAATEAPVTVAAEALQRLTDRDVVFIAAGGEFEAQPVEIGRRDAQRVEITRGLAAGQLYVAAGSFILKAEVGKSGAAHEH